METRLKKNINVKIPELIYRQIKHHQDIRRILNQPAKMADTVEEILIVGLQTIRDMQQRFSGNEGPDNMAGDPDKPRDRIGVAGRSKEGE